MPKVYHSVNTFNAGEVSELIFNREDIGKYRSSCRILENAFPLVEGGAKKMPGTFLAGEVHHIMIGGPLTDPLTPPQPPNRLVSFQFSTLQGAILEFSAGIIQIWEPLAPGEFNLGLVESGGGPIQLITPYTIDDLFELDCSTQSADTIWVFHHNYPPACVLRLGPSSWQYTLSPPGSQNNEPAYRGTPDVVTTGFSALGVNIVQATQAFPLVIVLAAPITNGSRVYVNGMAGMVELNEGEFFISSVLDPTLQAQFTGAINGGSGSQAGTIMDVSAVSSGTIYIGMLITGANVTPGTIIVGYISGSGSTGTYQVNNEQNVQSGTTLGGLGGYAYNLIPADDGNFLAIGSTSGTVLTVTSIYGGVIVPGVSLYFPGVVGGTVITIQISGPAGGVGTYSINNSQSASSQTMSTVPVFSQAYLTYEGGGFVVEVIPLFADAGDYPTCGTFYQGRLCVSGTDNNPTTLYGSVQDDYPDFICDPTEDDYGIQFTMVSNLLDQVVNAIGTPNALMLGTAGGVWAISGGTSTALTQNSVTVQKQTTLGVAPLQPQLIGGSVVFVSRSARQVMFIVYDFVSNQWNSFDLTRLNRQITVGYGAANSSITQTAFQVEPYPILWAVRSDGQLLGLVFNTQDQVYAWFRVNMQPEGGFVESVAVISGQGLEDMVCVVVRRTVNGSVVRYVEYFAQQELFNQLSNAMFVHCGLQLNLGPGTAITGITNSNPCTVTSPGHTLTNGAFVQISGVVGNQTTNTGMWQINQDKTMAYVVANANLGAGTFQLLGVDSTLWGVYTGGGTALPVTNQVTGLSYLLGLQVTAVGDGALILPVTPPTIVMSDSMTFPYYCAQITIGIPYKMTVQPSNPVLTSQAQTTRGMPQKLNRATVSLYQSMGGVVGTSWGELYPITYGPGQLVQVPDMTTGEYTRDLDGDWTDESTLYIEQNVPFPFTLRGLVLRMSYNAD